MPKDDRRFVVETHEMFDQMSEKFCPKVTLESTEQKSLYADLDSELCRQIDLRLCELLGTRSKDNRYYQNYDWWPSRTRFLSIEYEDFSVEVLTSLRRLLVERFADWVINIHVYRELAFPNEVHVGAFNLYSDKVLLTKSLEQFGEIPEEIL